MSISLKLPDCWEDDQPEEVELSLVPCLNVDEVTPAEVKAGSRTLIVTPYFPSVGGIGVGGSSGKICSGQYGQWQVLTGLGGQIHRGLYVGEKFEKELSTSDPPGISSEVDTSDCCQKGDRALAIRDRGRWYVVKLSSTAPAYTPKTCEGDRLVEVIGGVELSSSPTMQGIKRIPGKLVAAEWHHLPAPATAEAQVSKGKVVGAAVTFSGCLYDSAPSVTFSAPEDSQGSTASGRASLIPSGGSVLAVNVTACGSGYSTAPTVTFGAPPKGGVQAKGEAVVKDGKVVAVRVTAPGGGYNSAPGITFSGGTASATAIMAKDGILKIDITEPGSGYETAPAVAIGDTLVNLYDEPATWEDGIGWGNVLSPASSDSPIRLLLDENNLWTTLDLEHGTKVMASCGAVYVPLGDTDADADGPMPAYLPVTKNDPNIIINVSSASFSIGDIVYFSGGTWAKADPENITSLDNRVGLVLTADVDEGCDVLIWGKYKIAFDSAPHQFAETKTYWLKKGNTGTKTDNIEQAYPAGSTDVTTVIELCRTYYDGWLYWDPKPCKVFELCDNDKYLIPAHKIVNP